MCRSTERALQLAVAYHPDSRSWAVWSTAFDEVGQGALHTDVQQYADDEDGRDAATMELCGAVAEWFAGFSVKSRPQHTTP